VEENKGRECTRFPTLRLEALVVGLDAGQGCRRKWEDEEWYLRPGAICRGQAWLHTESRAWSMLPSFILLDCSMW
jgi:hypothetical protein